MQTLSRVRFWTSDRESTLDLIVKFNYCKRGEEDTFGSDNLPRTRDTKVVHHIKYYRVNVGNGLLGGDSGVAVLPYGGIFLAVGGISFFGQKRLWR